VAFLNLLSYATCVYVQKTYATNKRQGDSNANLAWTETQRRKLYMQTTFGLK